MLHDLLEGQKYKCYLCKKTRPHNKFWLLNDDAKKIGNRPVYIFCIDCDKIRKRKIKNKIPCKICNEYYKLYYNDTCKNCLKSAGIKKCYTCKDYLLAFFDFYCHNSKRCKKCDNVKRKETYRKNKKAI